MSWQLPICSKKALTITTTASSPSLSVARGAVERPQRNAVAQLQPMFTAQGDRLRLFENATGATLASSTAASRPFSHATMPLLHPVSVPAVPTPVAERPFAPPLTAVPAMLAPPIAATPSRRHPRYSPRPPQLPSPQVRCPSRTCSRSSLPCCPLSSPLNAATRTTRSRTVRNVRSRSDAAAPVASTSTTFAVPDAPIDAPNAPEAPTRSNDPARELVFGPRTSTPSVAPSSARA
ncbi:hypothetical protein B0H13DRAFT_2117585 [Mycena leptocephala]|nr:hypothetical protein B0H13DRAFT_2117585 [Mycena leptocephala]